MQEELRRIKNKDLKSLDQRLFGNLDKVQTINSTIQNLGQFQQFLLKQISQFEQKAKTNNKNKQVTQVIEMNCLTLRESIMNVVPDDMEGSHSRMRQTITSPINGFRSTRGGGFKKEMTEQESFRVHECKETELLRKIDQLELFKQNSIKRQEKLKEQLEKAKNDEIKALRQLESLKQENQRLKEETKRLKQQNSRLCKQIQVEKDQVQKKKQIEQLFQTPLPLSTQLTKPLAHQSSLMRKSQLKEETKDQQYMSFKDKMKFDFTSKLTKYHNSEVKLQRNLDQSQNEKKSDTFRESSNLDLTEFESRCEPQNNKFKSIEVSKNSIHDLDPNVPKILKRNSISGQNPQIIASQQALTYKLRVPLNNYANYESNLNSRMQYQSAQKNVQRCDSNTSKKVNHDLMRKTKSNFFKQPAQNKENTNSVAETFYDTSIAKMKGLVDQSNPSERKRNSQSKQKLKIFSMM